MKKKKAAGIDGLPKETWIYTSEGLQKRLMELLQKVWSIGKILQE